MRSFLGAVPLSALAAIVSIAVAYVLSPAVARRLGTSRHIAALLMLGFGLVLSATLVPTAAALEGAVHSGTCDTSRVGLASIEDLTSVTFSSLNVLLFVPLGIAVGLLPRTRAAAAITLAAILLTFAVEATQLAIPAMGRGCQTADIFDNLLGLAIGITGGLVMRPFLRG